MRTPVVAAFLVITFLFCGCTTPSAKVPIERTSQPIVIQTLGCNDPILGEMLTRSVKERLERLTPSVMTIGDGTSSGLVLRGTIYCNEVSASSSRSSGGLSVIGAVAAGSSQSAANGFAGRIVEGLSLIVLLDGKEIESETFFQTPRKGTYQPPQWLVQVATDRLCAKLIRRGLIVRR